MSANTWSDVLIVVAVLAFSVFGSTWAVIFAYSAVRPEELAENRWVFVVFFVSWVVLLASAFGAALVVGKL